MKILLERMDAPINFGQYLQFGAHFWRAGTQEDMQKVMEGTREDYPMSTYCDHPLIVRANELLHIHRVGTFDGVINCNDFTAEPPLFTALPTAIQDAVSKLIGEHSMTTHVMVSCYQYSDGVVMLFVSADVAATIETYKQRIKDSQDVLEYVYEHSTENSTPEELEQLFSTKYQNRNQFQP
jgi:hypothetical protein